MPIEILMPALSPTMEEGTLAKWLKKEGDEVSIGDVIAEIETDKATMEYESPEEGKLGKILVPDGTDAVPVNQAIALMLEEGEDAGDLDGYTPSAGGASKPTPTSGNGSAPAAASEPESKPSAPAKAESPSQATGERVFASPVARKMAAESNVALGQIHGSGPDGRIIKRDVEAAMQSGSTSGAHSTAAVAPASQDYEEVRLTQMRKVIAKRLAESKFTAPHFYETIDVHLDKLMAVRKELNEKLAQKAEPAKLTVNDFIIKAAALALRAVPEANASWGGDHLIQYNHVDVAVAVALDQGLITPIVRNADHKGLETISREVKDLASRARDNQLAPEEYQGGTFSVSNLGMFGIKHFTAIINPPQSCILAVGQGEQRPVVVNGKLDIATVMSVTLSSDHRVVDGALAARLLGEFRTRMEDPLSMLL